MAELWDPVRRAVTVLVRAARPQAGPAEPEDLRRVVGWYLRKGVLPALRGVLRRPLLGRCGWPVFLGAGVRIAYGRALHLGPWVSIGAGSVIMALSERGVVVGPRSTIREGAWIQCSSNPRTIGAGLRIGRGCYIGPGVIIGVGGPVEIGDDCQIGASVVIVAENHETTDEGVSATSVRREGISVGAGCWIGHRAVLLDGVELGAGCVVGAGAVVTRSFPAGSRVAGVPARLIGG
ncbi:MAG TPA: acyltransferase [Cellulomonas sp.]